MEGTIPPELPETNLNAHLVLQDIRPKVNRYRSYIIRIQSVDFREEPFYAVTLAWGRVDSKLRRLSQLYRSRVEVEVRTANQAATWLSTGGAERGLSGLWDPG